MPWVSQAEFARQADLSRKEVTKLKQRGVFDGNTKKHGKRILIDLEPAMVAYQTSIDPNFAKATPQIKNDGGNGDGKNESAKPTFTTWRTLTEQYKAARHKLEYDILAKKYLLRSEVESLAFKIGRQLRDDLRNIPARTAALLAAKSKKKENEIFQILMREIDKGLLKASKNLAKIG
jgi:hypothetical protein